MKPPKDPVPRKRKRAGATSEPHGQSDDYYYQNKGDQMVPNKQSAPKKTTEGYEPWQWDATDPRHASRTTGMVGRLRDLAIKQGLMSGMGNPLDYVDGAALGRWLKSNPTPNPKVKPGAPIRIADVQPSKKSQRYSKGPGRPD